MLLVRDYGVACFLQYRDFRVWEIRFWYELILVPYAPARLRFLMYCRVWTFWYWSAFCMSM